MATGILLGSGAWAGVLGLVAAVVWLTTGKDALNGAGAMATLVMVGFLLAGLFLYRGQRASSRRLEAEAADGRAVRRVIASDAPNGPTWARRLEEAREE